jgi:hypothetical protein
MIATYKDTKDTKKFFSKRQCCLAALAFRNVFFVSFVFFVFYGAAT